MDEELALIISKAPVFRGISPQVIAEELETIPYRHVSYQSKDIVEMQGNPCNHLMILVRGLLQGQMVNDAGKLVVIEELVAPRLVAPAFLFAPKNDLPVNIIAIEDSEVLFISRNDFTVWMQRNGQLLQNFLMIISGRSRFLSDKIMFLSLKNIKNKIAEYLLGKLTDPKSTEILLTETQQDIADFFGVTRPSLARAMGEMEQDGIITIDRKKVIIHKRNVLQQLAQ